MSAIRRHLRAWSAVWCLGQVAFLAAFVPRDCCAAHQRVEARATDEAATGAHCPMKGHDGDCPMHQAGSTPAAASEHAHGSPQAAPNDAECSMGSRCDGPLAALATLLSNPGIVSDVATLRIDLRAQLSAPMPESALTPTANSPDNPPPRV